MKFCILLATAFFGWQIYHVLIGSNTHTVVENKVYRSAQLTESALSDYLKAHGIKTVINMRGYNGWEQWYQAESRATSACEACQFDLTTSANVVPNPAQMKQLVEIFDRCEYPVLIHCRRGSDRTGLASGIYQLLYTDATLDEARGSCSPRYGHFRAMTTARMDEFFDAYEEYLRANAMEHNRDRFRDWILNRYQPGEYLGKLRLPGQPVWKLNRPLSFDVKAENQSSVPWKMSAGNFTGVHLRYELIDEEGKSIVREMAGQFDRVVPPGESVYLRIALPPIAKPGTYYLFFDLIGAGHVAFSKIGWEQTVWKFVVE